MKSETDTLSDTKSKVKFLDTIFFIKTEVRQGDDLSLQLRSKEKSSDNRKISRKNVKKNTQLQESPIQAGL